MKVENRQLKKKITVNFEHDYIFTGLLGGGSAITWTWHEYQSKDTVWIADRRKLIEITETCKCRTGLIT